VSGSKSPSSGGSHCRFDSVGKHPECTDHSRGADSVGPFANGETAFLIANTVVQNDPDQVTEAMSKDETTIDDLEDAAFVFDGGIGTLIENAAHLTVAFG